MYFQVQPARARVGAPEGERAPQSGRREGKGVSQKFVTEVRIQRPAAACIFKFNPRGRVLVRPRASARWVRQRRSRGARSARTLSFSLEGRGSVKNSGTKGRISDSCKKSWTTPSIESKERACNGRSKFRDVKWVRKKCAGSAAGSPSIPTGVDAGWPVSCACSGIGVMEGKGVSQKFVTA